MGLLLSWSVGVVHVSLWGEVLKLSGLSAIDSTCSIPCSPCVSTGRCARNLTEYGAVIPRGHQLLQAVSQLHVAMQPVLRFLPPLYPVGRVHPGRH